MKKTAKFLFEFLIFSFVVLIFLIIITDHENIQRRIASSLTFSFEKLIPSLYFSLAASLMLTNSGLYLYIGKMFSFTARKIFGVSEKIFSIFIMSNLAGYPTGAKLLSSLAKRNIIDNDDVKKAAPVMFSAGPAFILSVSHNKTEGIIIFISVFLTNLIMLFIYGRKSSLKLYDNEITSVSVTSENFVKSIVSAFGSMINIAAMISFFAVFTGILQENGLYFLSPVLEVSSITNVYLTDYIYTAVAAAYISFGGICVIFQAASELKSNFSALCFIGVRLFSALISSTISFVFSFFYRKSEIESVFMPFETDFNGKTLYFSDYFFVLLALFIILLYKTEIIIKKYKNKKI